MALHGGDDRLRQVRDLLDDFGMKMRLGPGTDVREYFFHIVAGGKIAAGPAYNDETDRPCFARNRIEMLVQRLEDIFGQRVQLLWTVEGQSGGTLMVFPEHEAIH